MELDLPSPIIGATRITKDQQNVNMHEGGAADSQRHSANALRLLEASNNASHEATLIFCEWVGTRSASGSCSTHGILLDDQLPAIGYFFDARLDFFRERLGGVDAIFPAHIAVRYHANRVWTKCANENPTRFQPR